MIIAKGFGRTIRTRLSLRKGTNEPIKMIGAEKSYLIVYPLYHISKNLKAFDWIVYAYFVFRSKNVNNCFLSEQSSFFIGNILNVDPSAVRRSVSKLKKLGLLRESEKKKNASKRPFIWVPDLHIPTQKLFILPLEIIRDPYLTWDQKIIYGYVLERVGRGLNETSLKDWREAVNFSESTLYRGVKVLCEQGLIAKRKHYVSENKFVYSFYVRKLKECYESIKTHADRERIAKSLKGRQKKINKKKRIRLLINNTIGDIAGKIEMLDDNAINDSHLFFSKEGVCKFDGITSTRLQYNNNNNNNNNNNKEDIIEIDKEDIIEIDKEDIIEIDKEDVIEIDKEDVIEIDKEDVIDEEISRELVREEKILRSRIVRNVRNRYLWNIKLEEKIYDKSKRDKILYLINLSASASEKKCEFMENSQFYTSYNRSKNINIEYCNRDISYVIVNLGLCGSDQNFVFREGPRALFKIPQKIEMKAKIKRLSDAEAAAIMRAWFNAEMMLKAKFLNECGFDDDLSEKIRWLKKVYRKEWNVIRKLGFKRIVKSGRFPELNKKRTVIYLEDGKELVMSNVFAESKALREELKKKKALEELKKRKERNAELLSNVVKASNVDEVKREIEKKLERKAELKKEFGILTKDELNKKIARRPEETVKDWNKRVCKERLTQYWKLKFEENPNELIYVKTIMFKKKVENYVKGMIEKLNKSDADYQINLIDWMIENRDMLIGGHNFWFAKRANSYVDWVFSERAYVPASLIYDNYLDSKLSKSDSVIEGSDDESELDIHLDKKERGFNLDI